MILVVPRLLNYIVAIYLIIIGFNRIVWRRQFPPEVTGTAAGTQVASTMRDYGKRAQAAMRAQRETGFKTAHLLTQNFATLASGILIGMSEGLGATHDASKQRRRHPRPAKSRSPRSELLPSQRSVRLQRARGAPRLRSVPKRRRHAKLNRRTTFTAGRPICEVGRQRRSRGKCKCASCPRPFRCYESDESEFPLCASNAPSRRPATAQMATACHGLAWTWTAVAACFEAVTY